MSQREFLYGSVSGDRVYDPLSYPRVWRQMTSTGVIAGYGGALQVVENGPPAQNVKVNLGVAFLLGHYFEVYGAAEILSIAAAHSTLPRIDRVIIRRSLSARTTALAVLTGTAAASPAAPALTQVDTGVWEISLAQILVPAASSSVVNSRITDERTYSSANLGSLLDSSVGHRHDGAAGGRRVLYSDLSNVPASFTPAAHSQDHGSTLTGLADDDHPQYQLRSEENVNGGYAGLDADANARVPAARLGTGTADATTYLAGDRTWKTSNAVVHDHGATQGGNVPYANVSGKPSSFAPSAHAHAAASVEGQIPYSNLTGTPSSMSPTAHAASHKTGGSDVIKASEVLGFDRYATVGTVGTRIYVGTTTPSAPAPAEGDIWIKA